MDRTDLAQDRDQWWDYKQVLLEELYTTANPIYIQ
jgi:hypothetical protein